jgi:hypothetical protein
MLDKWTVSDWRFERISADRTEVVRAGVAGRHITGVHCGCIGNLIGVIRSRSFLLETLTSKADPQSGRIVRALLCSDPGYLSCNNELRPKRTPGSHRVHQA